MTTTLVAAVCVIVGAAAQGTPEADAAIRAWSNLYADRARSILAIEDTDSPRTLTLHSNAILQYSNPVRPQSQHGSVHLWTDRGVPRMIGAIWSGENAEDTEQRDLSYEFHSLSESPLQVTLANTSLKWTPRKSGLEWVELKGLPDPHTSRSLRLVQMRRIAAGWQAAGLKEEAELRLLPQPLYRYPESVEGPFDGAIFAFVMGTDPELFIVLEAWAKSPTAAAGWRISPARLTGTPLKLTNDQDEVLWSSPTWERYDRELTYDFLWGIERQLPASADSPAK